MTYSKRNKITTLAYFTKRLKDSGFLVWKICNIYSEHDPRRWTVMVDPGNTSVFITCFENKNFKDEKMFEFNDGGMLFPRNFSLITNSMEVIVTILLEKGVPQLNNDKNEAR